MAKTSIFFSRQMQERRDIAKEVTGYPDQYIYEHGLLRIESEIAAARAREGKSGCPHPDRFPNGNCRFCLEPPASRPAADPVPVTFNAGTP